LESRCGIDNNDDDNVAMDILSIRLDDARETESEKSNVELASAYNPLELFLGTSSAAVDDEDDADVDAVGYHVEAVDSSMSLRRSSRENATTVSGTGDSSSEVDVDLEDVDVIERRLS
jgi:hypothetical protein